MLIVTEGPARGRPLRLFFRCLLAGLFVTTAAVPAPARQDDAPGHAVRIRVVGSAGPLPPTSGLVVTDAGHILAPASALGEGTAEILANMPAPSEGPVWQRAQLIASDLQGDLALLQVGGSSGLAAAGLGDSAVAAARARPCAPLRLGEPCIGLDGYVSGFVARPRDGSAPGSVRVVPVNTVKDFLEAHGLSPFLPRRLQLAPLIASEGKGLQLAAVEGLADAWPGRTRWMSGESGDGLSLRIDRIFGEASLKQLEQELMTGGAFEGFPSELVQRVSGPAGTLGGSAVGIGDRGSLAVEFRLTELRNERIVARYAGPADLVAYNRSTLRHSLDSITAAQLLLADLAPPPASLPGALDWTAQGGPKLSAPAGWVAEPVATRIPAGFPAPDLAIEFSPPNDYTVVLRALYWITAPASPTVGARTEPSGGSVAVDRYGFDEAANGIIWRHEGRYRAAGGGLLLLEASAPAAKAPLVSPLAGAWLSQ